MSLTSSTVGTVTNIPNNLMGSSTGITYGTQMLWSNPSVKLRKYILILKEYNSENTITDVKVLKEGWTTKTDDEIKASMMLERNVKQKDLEVRTIHSEHFV